VKRPVQNQRPDTVTTPKPVIRRDLFAVWPALTKARLSGADHEVPAVMTDRSGGGVIVEEGTPHPEPVWRVIAA